MSRSLNKAQIIGNLGADPEIRSTTGGTRVATLSVATSRSWNDREGQRQEKTEWHRVVAWEKLAEIAEKYLKRGDRVYIDGSIEYRSYQKVDETKYITEIRAREMIMLGGSGDSDEREPVRTARTGSQAPDDLSEFSSEALEGDDELPF